MLRYSFGCVVLLAAIGLSSASAQTPPAPIPSPQTPPAPASAFPVPGASPAYLTLGGYNVLCLRGTAGGMTPAERIDVITSRITPLLGNPVILPSDVVVYLPPPKSRYNRYPVIYALGRRIVTVDPATVKASGLIQTPLQAATLWAKRLQQVLPRVNWRPSNAPETKVPVNPPLTVTQDFTQVGGQDAAVSLRGKVVLKLRGPQTGGMTAAERADLLTARLERLASLPLASAPDAVQISDLVQVSASGDETVTLLFAAQPVVAITTADAHAAGLASPRFLALAWAKNLRAALPPPMAVLPSVPVEAVPLLPATPAAQPAAAGATVAPVPESSQ